MLDRVQFLFNRLMERLWVKPLFMCILSLGGAFLAKAVESTMLAEHLPVIAPESVDTLLKILSGSMLVIATFAVGSMVTSLASAGSTATPRTFHLVIADDLSQNALSIFVGAFIFSIVSILFVQNDYYEPPGMFALLALTVVTFAIVILTFVRWVDRIARLGRLGTIVEKVEAASARSLQRRRLEPTLGCGAIRSCSDPGIPVHPGPIGYVQRIDVEALQCHAEETGSRITIRALPGTFVTPDRVLASITSDDGEAADVDVECVRKAFVVGDRRTFDDDPRFGIVVLSQIAARALSPAVNDPGTAIDIIVTLVRLFAGLAEPIGDDQTKPCGRDRVEAPELSIDDLFDDAFTSIARDGAGAVEVAVRLQKALCALASIDHPAMRAAAHRHARMALARAESAMTLPEDRETVRGLAAFAHGDPS